MLDRERADFFRVLEAARTQLSDRCVAIQLPIGAEHELTGVVDLLHMCAYIDPAGGKEGGPQPIPEAMAGSGAGVPREAARRGRRDRRGSDGALPRGRGAPGRRRRRRAEGRRHARRDLSRSPAASRRRTSARTALLDLLVEGVPSPGAEGRRRSSSATRSRRSSSSRRSPTRSRAGSTASASSPGPVTGDTTLVDPRTHAKERLGQILLLQGKDNVHGRRARRRRPRRGREAEGRRHRRRARRPRGRPSSRRTSTSRSR